MSNLSALAIIANIQVTATPSLSTVSGSVMVADRTDINPSAGNAVGQADGIFTTVASVVSGTPLVINLETLTDPYGAAITVAHVVGLKITNVSGTGVLTHGGGSEPIYSAQPLTISVGDFYAQSFNNSGLAVSSGTAQNLQITTSTGTSSVRVTVLTRSA